MPKSRKPLKQRQAEKRKRKLRQAAREATEVTYDRSGRPVRVTFGPANKPGGA